MDNAKKIAFYTLGCKLNYAESSDMARRFSGQGYAVVPPETAADVYVINSCTVTAHAEKKCRQYISKLHQRSPQALIAVIGCYSQLRKEELAAIPGVKIVLGNTNKHDLPEQVSRFLAGEAADEPYVCTPEKFNDFLPSFSSGTRTRSFLKVQDGCDYACSYCTIPLARGFSRNPSVASLVAQANEIAACSIPEIVLTGVNVGDFGRTTGESFAELLKTLDAVEGIIRYRISSIEPNLLTDEIIELVSQSQRFAPHFHIPLQSGNNQILTAMRRRYTRELFADKVKQVKAVMPDACIGADVIVGFPGESPTDFSDTYSFISQLPLSYLHVFSYSERDNTPAAAYANQVPGGERMSRSRKLQTLSDELKRRFYLSQTEKVRPFIAEGRPREGQLQGFTDNYVRVKTQPYTGSKHSCYTVRLGEMDSDGDMLGVVI